MDTSVIPKFVVTIPVKPYVKRFIELNYGLPADFSKDPKIQEIVKRCLVKPCRRYDLKYKTFNLSTYSENLEIVISKHWFNHYGCEFSITDTIAFARQFEHKIKKLMRDLINKYLQIGIPIKTSIVDIRETLGLDESQWKYQSILKDYQRTRLNHRLSFNKGISANKSESYREALSNNYEIMYALGIVTKKFLKNISGEDVQ